MEDVIKISDRYYILASSSLAEDRTQVLKYGDLFAVLNSSGNIRPFGFENHGIYFEGTRFLSRLVISVGKKHPLLLSSLVRESNEHLTIDLTNPDIESEGGLIKKGTVHIFRSVFLKDNCYYERIRIVNYGLRKISLNLNINYDADYVDIFEVRGTKRGKRGITVEPVVGIDNVQCQYKGLDGITRKTNLSFKPAPLSITSKNTLFGIDLSPHESKDYFLTVTCSINSSTKPLLSYSEAKEALGSQINMFKGDLCSIETSNEQFNSWINRSSSDLMMMLTNTTEGFYPYAGIPWFNTVFGRDGIITALETLWIYPFIARGVLSYLSSRQATELNPEIEAEPGKILHEERKGEMANLKEIPFGLYYGSIDSTPLFLVLAGYYLKRTSDLEFIERIWPSIENAINWIDKYGDIDGDGFVEYIRKTEKGLFNQGWKDSEDSVFHSNGQKVIPPVALCEVQGYVYDARLEAAKIASRLGNRKLSGKLLRKAKNTRKKFHEKFWCEQLGTYAIALDKHKKPCNIKTSNAGHCLFSGIVYRKNAVRIHNLLMGNNFFSGWGIRTVASSEKCYNPMSYHNGSIWPHDNALIAYGFTRYGFNYSAQKILSSMFDASLFMESGRLPELFCGFERRQGEGPTLYPVACNPQTWASASVFMMLQACLGLEIDSTNNKVIFTNPVLPEFLEEVKINNLKIGRAEIDLKLEYYPGDVGIKITRRKGNIDLIIIK